MLTLPSQLYRLTFYCFGIVFSCLYLYLRKTFQSHHTFLCRPLRSYKCHVKMSRVTCHIGCIKHVRMSEIIRRMWWDNITCDIIWKVSEGETLPAMWKYQILLEYLRLFPPTSVLIRLWIWKSVKISDDTLWLWAWI